MLNCRTALLLLLLASGASAQQPDLKYEPDLTIDLAKAGVGRFGLLLVDSNGRIVVATDPFFGQLVAFDSTGARLPGWGTTIGRRIKGSDIGWIEKVGFTGDSLWVVDRAFDQVAILDGTGRVRKSIDRPSWVRPFWRDRRNYPLFRGMTIEAVYPDGSMLVVPQSPRALFDTPSYDRSAIYLLRVNQDGQVLRAIARLPGMREGLGRLTLRDGTQRKAIEVPYPVRAFWRVSADGHRIVIVTSLRTASDSGAFLVTMLNADGDTLFSRRHVTEAARIPPAEIESKLAAVDSFGRYGAEWIRDTLRKRASAFESRLMNVVIGVDYSTWIWVRSPVAEARALVIDSRGNAVGQTSFAPSTRLNAMSVDRIWTIQRDRLRTAQAIVRMRRVSPTPPPRSTTSRPTRSATASAPARRSR